MSKIIKILFIPCVLFLIVCFNFINVYAFESNECSIIFDGCDNYSDFRNKLNGSTNVYILVKIKDSEYENVKNEFQYYEIYSADFYISNYIPYISIIYDSDTEFISGYYEIEELAKFDYFEYIFISLELKSSKDDTLNTLINETTYSWKKVIEDIGLNSNNEYINGNIKIGMLENSVVEFDKISYNNTFGNTLNVTVYDYESDESSDGLNHATIVCSIIAEITKNIHSVSIHSGTIDNFLENLDLFCEENIKIVNISWGGYDSDTENLYTKLDAIFDAYSKEKNIVFIKSSGNENEGVTSPGKGGNVISVGACDSSYNIYEGSGYSIIDRKPTLIAPGVNLDLEFINDDNNNNNCNYYNGTSYSCAIVAGVVSLLYAQYSDNLNNVEIINSILIAGAKKLNKSDDSYNVKSGFGLINYQSSKNIIIGNKYNYYENVDTYYSITNTMPSYSSLEFILFTFSQYDIPEENNTDSLDKYLTKESICNPEFKVIVKNSYTHEVISESVFIDNVINLKVENLSTEALSYYVDVIDVLNSGLPFAIAIKNYGEYNIFSEKEVHYYESKYDLIFEEHNFIEEGEVLRCSVCEYLKSDCNLHEFVYTENHIECSNCSYIEFMDDIIVTDPNRYYECGSQINLYEDEISIYERSYKGNNIIQGYTRLLYFDSENIPSSSRLDYDWTSSDNSIATVSKYGTVTALNVEEEYYVTIIATYKFDSEIKFYKTMLIQPDTSNKIKSLSYTVNMKVDERYVFKFPDKYIPTQNVINYDWIVPCQKEEFAGVKMSSWGTITAIASGIMYINGWYNYNPNVIVTIKVIVET